MSEFNFIAIIVAAIAGYALGALWYTPKTFGNAWVEALGKPTSELGKFGKSMTINFITALFTSMVLAWLLNLANVHSLGQGILVSLIAALGLHVSSIYGDSQFANTSQKLVLINGGYRTAQIVVMGAILGAWH